MFSLRFPGKSLKLAWIFILLLLMNNACEKANTIGKDDTIKTYSSAFHFDISSRLLEEKHINCIETDTKGNTWIASNKELYFKNGNNQKIYTLDFSILDIAAASDETLWIGTNGGGLGHLTEKGLTWYTKANAGLPRDYISNVEAGLDGRIWFSSCASDLGGVVVYDGNKFKLFTPENSKMNQNVVAYIEIDLDGSVYIITSGKVTRISPFSSVKADKRNYCWLAGFRENSPVLHVYNGASWVSSPEGLFPDDFITAIETDSDNNIWAGTNKNGVFVLNQ
jgi:ligand-binding sensor domain-containing protein